MKILINDIRKATKYNDSSDALSLILDKLEEIEDRLNNLENVEPIENRYMPLP